MVLTIISYFYCSLKTYWLKVSFSQSMLAEPNQWKNLNLLAHFQLTCTHHTAFLKYFQIHPGSCSNSRSMITSNIISNSERSVSLYHISIYLGICNLCNWRLYQPFIINFIFEYCVCYNMVTEKSMQRRYFQYWFE